MDLSLKLKKYLTRPVALAVCLCFLLNTIAPSLGYAQALSLPAPGTMVSAGPVSRPALIKGLLTDDKDPFRFEFILAPGTSTPDLSFKSGSERLIKYFLAALATPEDELWVNLSPVEKDRIVPEGFGRTAMGRDLLAQDYLLKQITASLLHPDTATGKDFWKKVYAAAYEKYGTIDIPVDTFNKVWITPDKATVYTNGNKAYIVNCRMKVQLEADYLAVKASESLDVRRETSPVSRPTPDQASAQILAQNILRDVVIPILERDVNEGEAFATLRQVYHSLILAAWFKRKLQASILNKTYADKNRNAGLEFTGPNEQEIYQKYLEAYQKGAFNFIREETAADGDVVPRKYFSGGFTADKAQLDQALRFSTDAAQIDPEEKTQIVQVDLVASEDRTGADPSASDLLGNPLARNIFQNQPAAVKQLTLFLQRDHPLKKTVFDEIDRMSPARVLSEIGQVLKMPSSTEKGLILHDTSADLRTLALRTTSGGEDVPQSFSGMFMVATGQHIERITKSSGEKFLTQTIRNYYLLLKALWIISRDQEALSFKPGDLVGENSLLAYALSPLTVIRTEENIQFVDGSDRLLSQGTWLLTRLLDKDEELPHNLKSMTALLRKHQDTPGYRSIRIYLELLGILSGTEDRPDIRKTKKEELAAWAQELNRRPKKTETQRIESLAVNRLLRQAVQAIGSKDAAQGAKEFDETYKNSPQYSRRGLDVYRRYFDSWLWQPFSADLLRFKKQVASGELSDALVLDLGAGHGRGLYDLLNFVDPQGEKVRGAGISLTRFPLLFEPRKNQDFLYADLFKEGMPLAPDSVTFGLSVAGPKPRTAEEAEQWAKEWISVMKKGSVVYCQVDSLALGLLKNLRDMFEKNGVRLEEGRVERGLFVRLSRDSRFANMPLSMKNILSWMFPGKTIAVSSGDRKTASASKTGALPALKTMGKVLKRILRINPRLPIKAEVRHLGLLKWIEEDLPKTVDPALIRQAVVLHIDRHADISTLYKEPRSGNVIRQILEKGAVSKVWWASHDPRTQTEHSTYSDFTLFDKILKFSDEFPSTETPVILSIDLDAFASSVEEDNPEEMLSRVNRVFDHIEQNKYRLIGVFIATSTGVFDEEPMEAGYTRKKDAPPLTSLIRKKLGTDYRLVSPDSAMTPEQNHALAQWLAKHPESVVAEHPLFGKVVNISQIKSDLTPEQLDILSSELAAKEYKAFQGSSTFGRKDSWSERLGPDRQDLLFVLLSPGQDVTVKGLLWATMPRAFDSGAVSKLQRIFTEQDGMIGKGTFLLNAYLSQLFKNGIKTTFGSIYRGSADPIEFYEDYADRGERAGFLTGLVFNDAFRFDLLADPLGPEFQAADHAMTQKAAEAFPELRLTAAEEMLVRDRGRMEPRLTGGLRLTGFNDPGLTLGQKPLLHDVIKRVSTILAGNILESLPSGLQLHINTDIRDDFAPVFRAEDEQLGFIILEMIKNAVVHGHKMHLELPVSVSWEISPLTRRLILKVSNAEVTDQTLLDAIPADDLRFKWRLSGHRMGTRFIQTMTRGEEISLSPSTDGGTAATISVPLTVRYPRTADPAMSADREERIFTMTEPFMLPNCRIVQEEYPLTEPDSTIFPVIQVTLNGASYKIGGRHYVTVTLPDGKKVYWGGQHNLSYSFFFQHFGSQAHDMVMQKKVDWLHIDEHHDLEQYTNQTLPLPDITNVPAEIVRGYAGAGITFANYLGYLKASGIIQNLTHVSTGEALAKIPAGSTFRAFDFDVDITVDEPETGSLPKFQAMLPDLVRLAQASDVVFLTNSSELTRYPPGVILHIDFHQAVPFNAALISALAEKADRAQAQVRGDIEILNPPNELGSQGIHVRPSTNLALFFQKLHAEYPGLDLEITSLVNNETITESGVIGWLGGELSHQSSIRMSITSSRYPQPVLEKLFAFIRALLQDQSFLEGSSLSESRTEELKALMGAPPDRAMTNEERRAWRSEIALKQKDLVEFARTLPAVPGINWEKAAYVPWQELIRTTQKQKDPGIELDKRFGPAANRWQYWSNQMDVRKAWLEILSEALTKGLSQKELKNRIIRAHALMMLGESGESYYFPEHLLSRLMSAPVPPSREQMEQYASTLNLTEEGFGEYYRTFTSIIDLLKKGDTRLASLEQPLFALHHMMIRPELEEYSAEPYAFLYGNHSFGMMTINTFRRAVGAAGMSNGFFDYAFIHSGEPLAFQRFHDLFIKEGPQRSIPAPRPFDRAQASAPQKRTLNADGDPFFIRDIEINALPGRNAALIPDGNRHFDIQPGSSYAAWLSSCIALIIYDKNGTPVDFRHILPNVFRPLAFEQEFGPLIDEDNRFLVIPGAGQTDIQEDFLENLAGYLKNKAGIPASNILVFPTLESRQLQATIKNNATSIYDIGTVTALRSDGTVTVSFLDIMTSRRYGDQEISPVWTGEGRARMLADLPSRTPFIDAIPPEFIDKTVNAWSQVNMIKKASPAVRLDATQKLGTSQGFLFTGNSLDFEKAVAAWAGLIDGSETGEQWRYIAKQNEQRLEDKKRSFTWKARDAANYLSENVDTHAAGVGAILLSYDPVTGGGHVAVVDNGDTGFPVNAQGHLDLELMQGGFLSQKSKIYRGDGIAMGRVIRLGDVMILSHGQEAEIARRETAPRKIASLDYTGVRADTVKGLSGSAVIVHIPALTDAAMTDQRPQVSREFILLNPYHIHTKPSTVLSLLAAKLGNKLGVTIMVKKDGYGKSYMTSPMGLLSMFLTYSQKIEISVQGNRSEQVLTTVLDFVEKAMQDWHMLEEGTNDNPLYDAYLQEIDRIAENADAAQTSGSENTAPADIKTADRLLQTADPAKDARELKIVQRQFTFWPRRTPGWTDGERRKIPEILKSLHEAGFSLRGGTIQQENGEESIRLIEGITKTPRSAQSVYSESLKVYRDQGGWPAALKAAGLDPDEIQMQPGYTELFEMFRNKKTLKWGGPLGPVLKDFHEDGMDALPTPDAAQTPGGIDMDPSKLDLQETGRPSSDLFLPSDTNSVPEISGLVPVILDIRPAGNLRELLGAVR